MFAYCNNNPILHIDQEGTSSTIAGAIVGGLFGLINGIMGGGSAADIIACAVTGAAAGALAGFIADVSIASFGVGGAILASAFGGGISGITNSVISQSILKDGDIDWAKAASDGVFGAVMGGLCTSVNPLRVFGGKGIIEGAKAATALVLAEETMIITQSLGCTATALAFDTGATLITGFGGFVGGLAYDYYEAQFE